MKNRYLAPKMFSENLAYFIFWNVAAKPNYAILNGLIYSLAIIELYLI